MEDVAASIVGTAVEVLLKTLISLLAEEIRLIRKFKKDLEKLENDLKMIHAFLSDAGKQQVSKDAVKVWLRNLEGVAFDAENVLDELHYQVLRKKIGIGYKKIETRNKLKIKVQAFRSMVQAFRSKRAMARKIRDINDNLKRINKQAEDYGLQKHGGAEAPTIGSAALIGRETHSYSVDPTVFGRENHVSRMVEELTCVDEQAVFSVLAVAGMGGLGKTTLARLVFHDDKIETHFDKRIWVYVSQNFDAKNIFKRIHESVTGEKVDFESEDACLSDLMEKLRAKKYLLVLDDVWTEDRMKWDEFANTLSKVSFGKGNGIIVTTRSKGVASMVETIHIPKLNTLSDKDCWSIIKEKALGKGCVVSLELETLGEKIAKRCQGLPLAAKVVGGLLYGKSEEEWRLIEETKLSGFREDGNPVRLILKLSFDHLPSQSLKKCFAFVPSFPKVFVSKGEC